MSLDEMQEAFTKRMKKRNSHKKAPFVIGPKGMSFGKRTRRAITEGIKFKSLGRVKNRNPRYKCELKLGEAL